MNKFLKYLIFIFLGILIYLILNQINLFTIGGPTIRIVQDDTTGNFSFLIGDNPTIPVDKTLVDDKIYDFAVQQIMLLNNTGIFGQDITQYNGPDPRTINDPNNRFYDSSILDASISVEPQTKPPPLSGSLPEQGRWNLCTMLPCATTRMVQLVDTSCASSDEEPEIVTGLSVDFFAVHLDNLSTNCDIPYIDRNTSRLHTLYKETNYVVHNFNTEAMREGKTIQMYGGGDQTITEVGVLYVKQDIFDRILSDDIDFNKWISENAIFISFVDRGADFMSSPYRLDTAEFYGLNNNTLFEIEGDVYKPLNFYKLMQYRKVMGYTPTGLYVDISVLNREFTEWNGYLNLMCEGISIPQDKYYRLVRKDISSLFSEPDRPTEKANRNDADCIFTFMGTPDNSLSPEKADLLRDLSWIPLHNLVRSSYTTQLCRNVNHLMADPSTDLIGNTIIDYNLRIREDLYSSYAITEVKTKPSGLDLSVDLSIPTTSKLKDSKFFIGLLNEEIDIYNGIKKVDAKIYYPHDPHDYLRSQNDLNRSETNTRDDRAWNASFSVDYTLIDLNGNTFRCSSYDSRFIVAQIETNRQQLDETLEVTDASLEVQDRVEASLSVNVNKNGEFFPVLNPGEDVDPLQLERLILVTYKTTDAPLSITRRTSVNYNFTLEYPRHYPFPTPEPTPTLRTTSGRTDQEIRNNLETYLLSSDFLINQPETNEQSVVSNPDPNAPPIPTWAPRQRVLNTILDSLRDFVNDFNLHNKNPEEIFLRYLYYIHNRIDESGLIQIQQLISMGIPLQFAVIYLHIHEWTWMPAAQQFRVDGKVIPPTEQPEITLNIKTNMDEFFNLTQDKQDNILKLMCMTNMSMDLAIENLKARGINWKIEAVLALISSQSASEQCSNYNGNEGQCNIQSMCKYNSVTNLCEEIDMHIICDHVVELIKQINGLGYSITIEEAKNLLIQTNYRFNQPMTVSPTYEATTYEATTYEATTYYIDKLRDNPGGNFVESTGGRENPIIIFDFYAADINVLESFDAELLANSINTGINRAVEITQSSFGPVDPNDDAVMTARNEQLATLQWNYIEINNEMVDYINENPNEADQQSRRDEILALKPSILADQIQMDNMAQRSPHMVEAIRARDPAQFIEMMIDDDYFVQWAQTPGTYMGDTGGTDPVVVRLRILGNTALRQIWETALIEAKPRDLEDTLYTVDLLSIQRVPSNLTVFYFTKPYQYTSPEFTGLFDWTTDPSRPSILNDVSLKVKWACFKNETIIFEIFLPQGTQLIFNEFGMIYCFAVDTQFIKEYFMRYNIQEFKHI